MRRGFLFILYAWIMWGITGCSSFGGVAGNQRETYTSTYNMPGDKVVPYNNPQDEVSATEDKINVCEGIMSKDGFKCE